MKLFNAIKNLPATQFQSFQLFLNSPFFDIAEEVLVLFDCLKKHLKTDRLSDSELVLIKQQLKKRLPDCSKPFNKLVWMLNHSFEQFLAHSALEKNNWYQRRLAMQSCSEFAMSKTYHSIAQKTLKQLEKSPAHTPYHFLHKFILNHDLYFHSDTDKEAAAHLLIEAQNDLDRFYLQSKFKLAAEFFSRSNIFPEEHDIPLLDALLSFSQNQKEPSIQIYQDIYLLLKSEDPTALFLGLKDAFSTQLIHMEKAEQSRIFQILVNFANHQYTAGNSQYLTYLCELFRLGLQQRLYIEDNKYLNAQAYTNIIISFCLDHQFDEAYKILQSQKRNLSPKNRKDIPNLCMAYIHFHSKEFEKAWILLNKTNFTSTNYKVRARSLRVRCYYEQSHLDHHLIKLLKDELQNFRNFIKRSPIAVRLKNLYYNQIKVMMALNKFDSSVQSKSAFVEKWKLFLENHPTMAKAWLVKKLADL